MHQVELLACHRSLTSHFSTLGESGELELLKVNVWYHLEFEIPCDSDLYKLENIYCSGLLP